MDKADRKGQKDQFGFEGFTPAARVKLEGREHQK
jgi:hypothetical protein